MKIKPIFIVAVCCLGFTFLCELKLEYPAYFPEPVYNFKNNQLSDPKIKLGKKLFFDPILSKDLTISCVSCHSPYHAFAHTDHDLSHGINDQIGTRNAPALFNLAWQKDFMWDGAVNHLDMQALAPITHPGEMGESIDSVILKLKNSNVYPALFYQSYGDSIVTGERLLKALSQFQLTLIAADAKYDRVKQGRDTFNFQEQNGYNLFQKHCNTCHTEPLFSSYRFANNGLPIDTTLNDYGRVMITGITMDSLLFKIPSLRNLSYTYPYMHDGRFRRIRQVIRHYRNMNTGLIHPESGTMLEPITLTNKEETDLIAFLRTLNEIKLY